METKLKKLKCCRNCAHANAFNYVCSCGNDFTNMPPINNTLESLLQEFEKVSFEDELRQFVIDSCKKYAMSCVPERTELQRFSESFSPSFKEGWDSCREVMIKNIEQ